MMTIDLVDVSKRYSQEWILKHVNYHFEAGEIYGIEGSNGSGKSTLVKMISGFLSPSIGKINYSKDEASINRDEVFQHISIWGAHVRLIQELTIHEMVDYYCTFKRLQNGMSKKEFFDHLELPLPKTRLIKSLSSGQAQRLGLGLSILSQTETLLLDEPGSFLDLEALEWFYKLLQNHSKDRLVIISSNEEGDLNLTSKRLVIRDFK